MGLGVLGVLGAVAVLAILSVQTAAGHDKAHHARSPASGAEEVIQVSDPDDDKTGDAVEDGMPLDLLGPEIVEESLPSIDEHAFPELDGDFDGDGTIDLARARESDAGVQIAIDLSTTGETYVEPLGVDSLRRVVWRVVGPEELLTICDNPVDCPTASGLEDVRDVILVTLDGADSFILHWDGTALGTYFVDA